MTNKCMSYNATIKKRCKHDKFMGSDFCRYHKRYSIYDNKVLIDELGISSDTIIKDMNNYLSKKILNSIKQKINDKTNFLDENYKHNLMMLYNSWSETNIQSQIKLSGEWWDLPTIVDHITQQLNHSDMENPFPMFPSNPFNRKIFSIDDIISIKNRVNYINYKIDTVTHVFINLGVEKLLSIISLPKSTIYQITGKLITILSTDLRFRLMNNKNSQSCYIGRWVNKKTPLTQFEIIYNMWKETPYQIYNPIYGVIHNDHKDYLKCILNSFPDDD